MECIMCGKELRGGLDTYGDTDYEMCEDCWLAFDDNDFDAWYGTAPHHHDFEQSGGGWLGSTVLDPLPAPDEDGDIVLRDGVPCRTRRQMGQTKRINSPPLLRRVTSSSQQRQKGSRSMAENEQMSKQVKFNLLYHFREQPFISATALAALMHSAWTLATMFGGTQPDLTNDPISWLRFSLWGVPALLVAFALDIGQIVTSAEIRHGERNRSKYATFGVLAVATYYLQFTYMAHHIPLLTLGDGVAQSVQWIVMPARDLAIFIIPALLPVSTLLYTLSYQDKTRSTSASFQPAQVTPSEIVIETENVPALPQPQVLELPETATALDATADYKTLFERLPNDRRKCLLCGTEMARQNMQTHYKMHLRKQESEQPQ